MCNYSKGYHLHGGVNREQMLISPAKWKKLRTEKTQEYTVQCTVPSGSQFKSLVTKLVGKSPSPRLFVPFHQFGSLIKNIMRPKNRVITDN